MSEGRIEGPEDGRVARAAVFDGIRDRLLAVAHRHLCHLPDAEDAIQEVASRITGDSPRGNDPRGWERQYYTWAANQCRSELRRRKPRAALHRARPLGPEADLAERSPEEAAARADLVGELLAALEEMPDDLAGAVRSRMRGEKLDTYSAREGCSAATASRRVHRGLEWLRRRLGCEEASGQD
ncbi:MAG: sigma-70 family RNA polymerase sigma factor [Gemmataceae bacterium]|nr:sigma-70 family RNA polymerase sigma factor [Gemmataceae bacterium]